MRKEAEILREEAKKEREESEEPGVEAAQEEELEEPSVENPLFFKKTEIKNLITNEM